jgi:hypothetical protein
MAEEHPAIHFLSEIVRATVRQTGSALWFAATHPQPQEGHGDSFEAVQASAQRAFSDFQALPREKQRDIQDGAAFIASFGLGGVAETFLPKIMGPVTESASRFVRPGPVLGKWGSFAANEFLGGGVYGATRSLDEDESRASAIFGDAATFATLGLGFRATGEGIAALLKRRIMRLPEAKRTEAQRIVQEGLSGIRSDLSSGGVNLTDLPPDARAKLEEPILQQALLQVDPAAVNLEQVVREEADRATIDKPFDEARPTRNLEDEFDRHLAEHPLTKTPPLEESAAALPEVKPGEERLANIAVMGRSGRVYKPKRGEITHPELFMNLIELDGVSPNEFFDSGAQNLATSDARGYSTTKGAYVTVKQAEDAGLRGQTLAERAKGTASEGEQIVGPAVRGRSGDTYVGGTSHPEVMAQAIRDGVPKREFKGALEDADHPNRGFRTTHREFITREQAAELTGHPTPLYSEDMHAKKMLPTESTEAAERTVSIESEPVAALNAATDHAVAQLEPLQTATPGVKSATEEVQKLIEIHGLPEKAPSRHLRDVLSTSLDREGPAAEIGVTLALTQPGPIELQLGRKIGANQIKRIREQLERTLRRERSLIEVSPHERVAAPWQEVAPELIVPKKLDGFEIAGHVKDTDQLNQALMDVLRNRSGFIKPEYLARLTAAGVGGTMSALGWFDDNLPDGMRTGLKAYGAFILLASMFPGYRRLMERSQLVRDLVKTYSPGRALAKGGEEWRQYGEAFTRSSLRQHEAREAIKAVFPDEASLRAGALAIDEGPAAPEFHALTTQQQQMAVIAHQVNLRLGLLAKANRTLSEHQESFIRHLLPESTFQRWKELGGARALPQTLSIRGLEDWTKKQGLKGPVMDASVIYSRHLDETHRMLAVARLRNELLRAGTIQPLPSPGQAMPPGWREIKDVPGMANSMAPEEDAHDLRIISSTNAPKGEVLNALDRVKSRWVKSIMFWWWEHGVNAMRTYLALSFNPTKYFDGVEYLKDPAIREEMAANGVNVFGQSTDYMTRVHGSWKDLLSHINLPGLGASIDKLQEKNDRLLWEKIIPALQTFAYVTRMKDWTERNAGKFGEAEYIAEGRRVGDFVNTIAGKVPQHLADKNLARGMRLLMFSPQWTGTRMAMWMHAAGEASDVMAGKLDPRNALYLPMKLRQLAWGVALTYVGSMLMSGKPPEFNPNNSRFYMRTGSKDSRGREVGVDLTGWWQDEFRFASHPFDFIMNRLNPVLKVGLNTIEGRDYLGRPMTTGQTIGNIISSLGPPAQIGADVAKIARTVAGKDRIAAGDIWQMASRSLATGNVAVLPPAMNATLAKYARKILIQQGIPASSDHVYELAQRMRSNLLNGRDLIDEGTISLLASRKRSSMWEFPLPGSAAFSGLWQEARGVLADFQQ